jgi:hypothetical protein
VAPLQLGGLRGKHSTPSDWLGGTGGSLLSASRSGKERGTSIEARKSIKADEREKVCTLFGRVDAWM